MLSRVLTNIGATRAEYEYEIPIAEAEELLKLCDGPIIEKVRHAIDCNSFAWEVELEREDQCFERPGWLGQEVTDDIRYFNANLCNKPYCTWHLK